VEGKRPEGAEARVTQDSEPWLGTTREGGRCWPEGQGSHGWRVPPTWGTSPDPGAPPVRALKPRPLLICIQPFLPGMLMRGYFCLSWMAVCIYLHTGRIKQGSCK
jgi:hypothetical protein